jgi:glycosyltransferase involved in cell wall biosynthesis
VIRESTYAIVANGFGDGPAQALRDYLVARGASVVTAFHPLTREQGRTHELVRYERGAAIERRLYRLPLRPPASFAADPFVPVRPLRAETWFGFNPLACARGLAERRFGHVRSVVLWSVDFAPDRFGAGTILTRLYDRIDRISCQSADVRVELSEASRDGRNRRHGIVDDGDTLIVPMGAWLERVPVTAPDAVDRRHIVYLGHLVARQGVDCLIEALALLKGRGEPFVADVIGTGPDQARLADQVRALGLESVVRLRGFVADHRHVEAMLAAGSIAVAPYRPDATTFTRFADPGKLKAYVAAGLPIVVTDFPPNARELAREAGAEIVPYEAAAIADALQSGLASKGRWQERRAAALRYARRFDWPALLDPLVSRLDAITPAARGRGRSRSQTPRA